MSTFLSHSFNKKHFLYILKQVVPPPPPPPPILDFFSKTSVALTPLCLSQSKTFVPSLQLRDLIISPHTLIKSLSCHFVSTDKDFISIFLHSKSSINTHHYLALSTLTKSYLLPGALKFKNARVKKFSEVTQMSLPSTDNSEII